MRRIRDAGGQALVGVVILLLMLLIIVPILVRRAQEEHKQSDKLSKASVAYQAAEAGISRGRWKLGESDSVADQIQSGPLENYNFDKTFSEVAGAEYKIWIASGSSADRYQVSAIGRDLKGRETRRIDAVFRRSNDGFWLGASDQTRFKRNVELHWAPLYVRTDMDFDDWTIRDFPRKYATGEIDPYDTDEAEPNTDGQHYWAFTSVGDPPSIDFAAVKSSAQAVGTYYSGNADWKPKHPPPCDEGEKGKGGESVEECDPKADDNLFWYVEGNLKIEKNSYVHGKVVVLGDCEIKTQAGAWGGAESQYTITELPPNAAAEYYPSLVDTVQANEWYGDMGGGPPSTLSTSFQFQAPVGTQIKDGVVGNPSLRGFLYCGGKLDVKQFTGVLHAAIISEGKTTLKSNESGKKGKGGDCGGSGKSGKGHDAGQGGQGKGDDDDDDDDDDIGGGDTCNKLRVFYNHEAMAEMPLTRSGFTRESWNESRGVW